MNYDIGDLLNSWEFKPDEFLARRIRTSKGEEKLQIRIDMGLLQLELDGRPDGQRPHGCPSLLDYYQDLIESRETPEGFVLGEDECEELFQEAWQLLPPLFKSVQPRGLRRGRRRYRAHSTDF